MIGQNDFHVAKKLLFYTTVICALYFRECTCSNGCETGYYYENGRCNLCSINCSKCSSGLSCTVCKTGNYGTSCSLSCSDNCHDNECSITTGQCLSCKTGYFMDETGSCVKCPNNCTTCKSNTFCFACKNGYKGESCQESCSDCEIDSRCDKNTGYCLDRCRRGFSAELCNIKCDLKCTSCDRLIQSECISCAQDRYGLNCSVKCSLHCLNNSCTDSEGVCTGGCVAGYWGGMCNNMCSKDCKDNICNITNGVCLKANKQTHSNESTSPAAGLIIIAFGVILVVVVLPVIVFIIYLKRNHATLKIRSCDDHTSLRAIVQYKYIFGLCRIDIEEDVELAPHTSDLVLHTNLHTENGGPVEKNDDEENEVFYDALSTLTSSDTETDHDTI